MRDTELPSLNQRSFEGAREDPQDIGQPQVECKTRKRKSLSISFKLSND